MLSCLIGILMLLKSISFTVTQFFFIGSFRPKRSTVPTVGAFQSSNFLQFRVLKKKKILKISGRVIKGLDPNGSYTPINTTKTYKKAKELLEVVLSFLHMKFLPVIVSCMYRYCSMYVVDCAE